MIVWALLGIVPFGGGNIKTLIGHECTKYGKAKYKWEGALSMMCDMIIGGFLLFNQINCINKFFRSYINYKIFVYLTCIRLKILQNYYNFYNSLMICLNFICVCLSLKKKLKLRDELIMYRHNINFV